MLKHSICYLYKVLYEVYKLHPDYSNINIFGSLNRYNDEFIHQFSAYLRFTLLY